MSDTIGPAPRTAPPVTYPRSLASLPDRKTWTRRPPGVEHLVVGTSGVTEPLEEVQDQVVESVGHLPATIIADRRHVRADEVDHSGSRFGVEGPWHPKRWSVKRRPRTAGSSTISKSDIKNRYNLGFEPCGNFSEGRCGCTFSITPPRGNPRCLDGRGTGPPRLSDQSGVPLPNALHKMQAEGLIKSRACVVNGRSRRLYAATAKGRRELAATSAELRELAREVLGEVTP